MIVRRCWLFQPGPKMASSERLLQYSRTQCYGLGTRLKEGQRWAYSKTERGRQEISKLTCALRAAFPISEALARGRSINKGGGLNTNDVENLIIIRHGTSENWYFTKANRQKSGGIEEE